MEYALADTIWGPHVVPYNDVNVGVALMVYGEYAKPLVDAIRGLLKPGDVALDIGAHCGAVALPMLRAVGPTGLVLCFEPQAPLARACHATLALNADAECFAVHNVGVGRCAGTLHVPALDYEVQFANFGCVGLVADGGTPVPVLALDDLDLPPVAFVKIDAEGMEADVLAGARHLIDRYRPIMVIENDRAGQYLALIERVKALGYDCYWLATDLFNPNNYRGATESIYKAGCASLDMVCIPAGTVLPAALAALPPATEANAARFGFVA